MSHIPSVLPKASPSISLPDGPYVTANEPWTRHHHLSL